MKRDTAREAAEALLDAGLSLPLLRLRLPWMRPRTIRIVMRRPFLGDIIRLAKERRALGVTYAQMARFTPDEAADFLAEHGHRLARMVARTVCRGLVSGPLLRPLLAWIILHGMPREYLLEAQSKFIALLFEVRDFQNIIASVESLDPLRPVSGREKTTNRR